MEKLSVKKPFTILVAVIVVIVLGVVSLMNMTADLLPDMSLPYLMVVTTYPGASPERVESDVVRPMESALGTVSGVKNVMSTCGENFGMIQLEFADDTDMDSTLVKVNTALQQVTPNLPDMCGTPSIIELSMDMMATMYVSVSREGYDIFELSAFVTNTVQPYIERQPGVASVNSLGLVEQSVQVELDQKKIDKLNEKLLLTISDTLAKAKEELDKAESEVAKGKEELQKAQSSFGQTLAGTLFDQLEGTVLETADQLKAKVNSILEPLEAIREELSDGRIGRTLDVVIDELKTIKATLEKEDLTVEELLGITGNLRTIHALLTPVIEDLIQQLPEMEKDPEIGADVKALRAALDTLSSALNSMNSLLDSVPGILAGLEDAIAGLTQAQLEAAVAFATASTQLSTAEAQLEAGKQQFEQAREQALASANLDQLLSINTLSQLIYAQNFSMPAGYIDDKNDNSWLLKVGEEFTDVNEMANTLLVSMDAIGEVRLSDVANVTVIDNAGLSYARYNGEQAVVLSIFKDSVTGTNETSKNCQKAFDELKERYEGTGIVTLMNQGSFIDIIIDSILSSMIVGAVLAMIILALFLKDVKPTLVVAISIPLSVMFAIVLMYFTNISLNMMTLSGLALGIGMLVDNSVVVIENIYRLRGRGIEAPRASVQGTKQVAGAIISSTLTTVCVFLPMVFTSGMVRELLLPLGLSIGFCLMASLIVALTVVPASASTLLSRSKPKEHPWFDKVLNVYGKFLNWCLDRKWVPLTAAVTLLAITIYAVLTMGIVLLPDMSSTQISVSVTTPEGLTREESYAMADDVIDKLLEIDGVDDIGVMDSSATSGLLGGLSMGGGESSYGTYVFYIVLPDDTSTTRVNEITGAINKVGETLDCELSASAGGVDDMTAMLGSGLSVKIYGNDIDTLIQLSSQVMDIVAKVPGYTDIRNGTGDGDPTYHLKIDRDAAMAKGLTVAQIYMAISEKMTTSSASTNVTLNGVNMSVSVTNPGAGLKVEDLMDLELTTTTMDSSGNSVTGTVKLSEIATLEQTTAIGTIDRENQSRYITVSAGIAEGYNATLLSRELSVLLDEFSVSDAVPYGYSVVLEGESTVVNDMVSQLGLLLLLGCLFIYLVMVAQFQSLLSPFIVLFTVPLAFTGGMLGLLLAGQHLSLLSLMGFAVLMGTIVNNGIVFVDYVNQLRTGGMDRRSALIATGKTRMRPILMTALTTILAMMQLIFSDNMAGQLGGGMAIVIVGGMIYGTLMTLIIVPVIYDILFKRDPRNVDIGSESLDDIPDDAAEFIAQALAEEENRKAAAEATAIETAVQESINNEA